MITPNLPVPPQPPTEIYVIFSAEINPNTSESLTALMSNCVNQGVKRVHLLFSTPGGTVMNGITLYNTLRAMPFELIMYNVGNVDSIGNAIFLAGQKRYASQHSTFMFHGVGFDSNPGQRLEEALLKERLDGLMADQKRIGAIIQERTSLKTKQIADMFKRQRTNDAAFAVRCGIIDEIREVQIPPGATVISLVFQR